MKRDGLLATVILAGLLLNGCSNKEVNVEDTQEQVKRDVVSVTEKSDELAKQSDDVSVEVVPVSDKKVEVITKVKPEVTVIETEKVQKGEIPIVIVDPVKVNDPIKVEEVEILPVVDDTVDIVTKVKPTIEVIEELPLESNEAPAIIVDPIVE